MTKYTYEELTLGKMTNLFLWGQETRPQSACGAQRSAATIAGYQVDDDNKPYYAIQMDMNDFMANGPGKYIHPSDAKFVRDFFSGAQTIPSGASWTKDQIMDHLGLTGQAREDFDRDNFRILTNTAEYQPGAAGYDKRTYIYGHTTYEISDSALFTNNNGVLTIANAAVHPFTENFDFESSGISQLGNNGKLAPAIDPNSIGVTVRIEFLDKQNVPSSTYNQTQFANDQANTNANKSLTWLLDANGAMNNVLQSLTQSGTIGNQNYGFSDGQIRAVCPTGTDIDFNRPDDRDWLEQIKDKLDIGKGVSSPLVLDLSGDGLINLTNISSNDALFDIDKDGFAESVGWVNGASGDGFLAIDLNSNAVIDDSGELFGNQSGFSNGFLALALHDTNNNGVIEAGDSVFQSLIVWVDGNNNGYSESYELFNSAHFNITQIALTYSDVNYQVAGNTILQEGSFVMNGATRKIADAYFQVDQAYSFYQGSYSLDSRTYLLPAMRGYGDLKDLHVAMSIDNTSSGNLLSLVKTLNDKTFAQLFDATTTLSNDIRAILFKWAGVESVSTTSRGSFVNGQELAFLEKLTGEPFLQRGIYSNPQGFEAGYTITESFRDAFNIFYARLVSQSAGQALFEGNWQYKMSEDSFSGITGLSQSSLDALKVEALGLSNTAARDAFWSNVLRVIEFSVGVSNLDSSNYTKLNSAIENSDSALDLNSLLQNLDFVRPSGINEDGTSAANTMNGSSGNDDLGGGYGNDTLNGLAGNDKLYGEGDNDTLNGGTGGDYLVGGFGSDTYNYAIGDGQDTVLEEGTGSSDLADKIVFGSGITLSNLTLTRVGNTDLVIDIGGSTTGKIVIENQFNYSAGGGSVETLQFAGGSTYSLIGQAWSMHGTGVNDTLYGVSSGGLTTDTIYGDGGNDSIDGGAGNDTLYGGDGLDFIKGGAGDDIIYGDNGDDKLYGDADNDTIYGGAGNDYLEGAAGNDIYWYVSGIDTIVESAGTETLKLDAVWNAITPQYLRIGNDLQLFFDANNIVTVKNHWAAGGYVETLLYANGTSVNLTTVSYVAQGTSGNDTLTGNTAANTMYGLAGNDTMNGGDGNDIMYGGDGIDTMQGQNGNDNVYGEAGNDTIYGNAGNDYLDGGAGNDYMQGGTDNDTYFYSSGIDQIYDQSGVDNLKIAAGYDLSDAVFARRIDATTNSYDLRIEFSPTNFVWIDDYFNGTASAVETLQFADLTSVTLNTLSYTVYGSSAGETIAGVATGGLTNDIMYGMGGNDTLNGDAGDEIMYGGAGNDTLYGGAGNDTYVFESGLDTFSDLTTSTDKLVIMGSTTVDGISFSSSGTSDTKITINAGIDEVTVKNLRSTSQYHVETIEFFDGFRTTLPNYASWVNGTSGNDTQTGTSLSDTILGKAGNDTIDGAGGNDYIHGGAGDDTLKGGAGDDLVHGGIGVDLIYGQDGLDTLYGGSGADTFFFEAVSAYNNIDVIKDFSLADGDKLNLANLLTSYNPLSHAIEDFVKMTDNSGNTFVSVDRDGTGTAYSFQQVATISAVTGLTDEASLKAAGTLIAA